jgi:muramoyltetrapeptide carboxypeptidase
MTSMPAPRDILKPPPLRRGDTVGIVAPASNIQRNLLDAGIARLRELGYQVIVGDHVYDQDLYFAGTAEVRARDLMRMFERDDVQAIVCARGGYGSNYLLPLIDLDLIRRHPKILVGYSDLTSLLTLISDETGLVTFHGPMVTKDFAHDNGVHLEPWFAAMEGKSQCTVSSADVPALRTLSPGSAEGTLYGGCLSILVSSLGTRYGIETGGAILFLEDVGAKPYQIDRMLMQMKYAGVFDGVRGIVFGEMLDCIQPGGQEYTLEEVIERILGDLGVPIVYGLPSGHVRQNNITLPIGVHVSLRAETDSVTLRILEPAVSTLSARVGGTRMK